MVQFGLGEVAVEEVAKNSRAAALQQVAFGSEGCLFFVDGDKLVITKLYTRWLTSRHTTEYLLS
jgi:hypothetical protein